MAQNTNSIQLNKLPAPENRTQPNHSATVLRQLAAQAAQAVAAKACCIYLFDEFRQELIPETYWAEPGTFTSFTRQPVNGSPAGLAVQRWQNGKAESAGQSALVRLDHLDNEDFPHSTVLAHPFTAPGDTRLLGVLLVADKIGAPAFLPQDEQRVIEFALRFDLALAVQNVELVQEKQRWDQELAIINQINQTLAAAPQPVDQAQICRLILEMPYLKNLFQFDIAEICLWDEPTQTLTIVHRLTGTKADPQAAGRTYHLHQGYSGWLAAHPNRPLLINDTAAYAAASPKDGLQQFPYRSYLGAPLNAANQFLGTLELAAAAPNFYDARDLALLEIAANQAATAVDFARRFSLTDQQLQTRAHELAALQRVSRELNSTLDLDSILNLVLEEAMRVTRADFGNVSLYQAQTQTLTAHKEQAGPNLSPLPAPAFDAVPTRLGLMGRALTTGEAVLVGNVADDPDFVDYGRDTRAQVAAPIFYGGEPAGVINLESQALNCFTTDQLRYLEALANHAAVAIGNAQAYQAQKIERERASRRADQLTRLAELSTAFRTNRPLLELLEDVAYSILESVGYNVVIISLVQSDPPVMCHQVGAGIPLPEFEALKAGGKNQPLAEWLAVMQPEFSLGHAYFIPAEHKQLWQDTLDIPAVERVVRPDPAAGGAAENLWQDGDLLFVPLTDPDSNIIGMITVQNPDTNLRPDLLTAQTLEIFANHAAAAIENARLFTLEQQRRRLADTLRGVAETISSQLELDQLLNIVLQELKKVVDYDSASVQRLDENRLVIIGGHGWADSQQVIGLSFSMEGVNPNRRVVEWQEPVIVKDVQQEYPAIFSVPPHEKIHSWLGVPLTYGTNVLGLMAVDHSQPNFFTADDAGVVLAFANQVAVALQNARLFDEARQQVRHLAALTDVAQSINRALNLDEVLNLVLDAVFDLVGESKGSIWLVDAASRTVKIANTKNVPQFLVDALNESAISVDAEPFVSVIKSGQVLVVAGGREGGKATSFDQPFPDDVTYVPLKTEQAVIGILAIESVIHQKGRLQLVTTLADLAAVAIENARLVHRLNSLTEDLEERVEQRTRQLAETLQDLTNERDRVETLYQITRELTTSLDLDRVLTEALNLINRAIGIAQGSILLLDHGSGELIYRAALGRDKPLPRGGLKTQYRLAYGLAGTVMELNQPRIVPSLSEDPDWLPSGSEMDQRSAIAVPLTTGEGLMGALLLFHPEPDYFTEDHLKLVNAAGAQIANAINNAELYRLITDQAERLGMMLRTQATEAAKNEAILKGIADGVLVLDPRRNIILFNPKAAEIFNVDPAAVENKPVARIVGQAKSAVESELAQQFYDRLLEALQRLETGSITAQFRIEIEHKAVVVTLSPVALGIEETLGIVAVIRDISREAEIERLKNEFISTVSHELRTPLTSIKGYADLLASANEQVGALTPLQNRFVGVIQANANRLTELVNDILEISRIETGRIKLQFDALDVAEILKEVTVSFEGQLVQKTMTLALDLPPLLPPVWADKARLVQVLVNLVGNAWQYTPEGGKITVSAVAQPGFVQIDVADTGIGIPAEDIDHIFDRFFRSERHEVQLVDGTGLGLSITKSFVEMLGGNIWLKSEIDQGTTFSFTVPVAA